VLDGEVISRAHNEVDSEGNDFLHAELSAIQQVAHELFQNKGRATIYTTLEPCSMCAGAIVNAGIPRIVVAAPDKFVGAVNALKTNGYYARKLSQIESGVLELEVQHLLNRYVDEHNCRQHLKV
jgi:tRNA(adenine34) deaminase